MNLSRTLLAAAAATSLIAVIGCSSPKSAPEETTPAMTVPPAAQEPVADTSSMPSHPALPAERPVETAANQSTPAEAPKEQPAPEPVVAAAPEPMITAEPAAPIERAPRADRN